MRKLKIALVALLACASARPNVHTPWVDFIGTGVVVKLSAPLVNRCSWIQIIADPANAAPIRFGDSSISSTNGLKIAAGAGYTTPVSFSGAYDPNAHYLYIANGDKAYAAYGD